MDRISSAYFNLPRHRSHSCRTVSNSKRELQWLKDKRNNIDSFSPTSDYIDNIRTKLKTGYDQLLQQKLEEAETHMNQVYDEERRAAQRKLRKTQNAHERFRLQTIDQILREQDAICEEKLAAQRSLYNRLLDEQAQRFKLEKNFQSYENLNVDQLKERLTRVENSNFELQQLVQQLLNQKPTYKNTIFIPRASK